MRVLGDFKRMELLGELGSIVLYWEIWEVWNFGRFWNYGIIVRF